MTDYQILFSKKAQKDIAQLTTAQKEKIQEILQQILAINPYLGKALKGKLSGFYSYRLNRKDRIVYEKGKDCKPSHYRMARLLSTNP